MVASLIDGKSIAKTIRDEISQKIKTLNAGSGTFKPTLAIFQIGNRPDSATYVRMKRKAAEEAGIEARFIHLEETVSEHTVLAQIQEMNEDSNVHGVLVQLPLPAHIDEDKVTSMVAARKDVDGFGPFNIGELNKKNGKPFFHPCTPQGIIELLIRSDVTIAGAKAVVIGRSDIVGAPVAELLKAKNATVTVVHSKTKDIPSYVATADIVVVAIGQPEFVKGEWFKGNDTCVVIDVGTNYVDDATKKSGYRCVGDVEFEAAKQNVKLITPVPGGVGPMTVAMLMSNVYKAAERSLVGSDKPAFQPLPLDLLKPVPSDFEISRSQRPKEITQVAAESGILPTELEPYGSTKAKVKLDILDRLESRQNGKYVLVAGITPTPLGEGKSTTTVGLAQALGAHLKKTVFANVRQPSMGPTFGIKGGAAGGGYSQVIPMDEFNLHVTGDIHAISMANNLLAAAIDTRMFHEQTQKDAALYKRLVPTKRGVRTFTPTMLRRLKKLGINKQDPNELTPEEITQFARLDIDPETITWKRVVDLSLIHI